MIKPEQQLNNRLFINIDCLPFKHTPNAAHNLNTYTHTHSRTLSLYSIRILYISHSIRLSRFVFNLSLFSFFIYHFTVAFCFSCLPHSARVCFLCVCLFSQVLIRMKNTERTICLFVCSNVVDGRGHTIYFGSTTDAMEREKGWGEREPSKIEKKEAANR